MPSHKKLKKAKKEEEAFETLRSKTHPEENENLTTTSTSQPTSKKGTTSQKLNTSENVRENTDDTEPIHNNNNNEETNINEEEEEDETGDFHGNVLSSNHDDDNNDPLNRLKKASDNDLDENDRFLKNFLFKRGWIFDYEKHGDRYAQQAQELDKGDVLDDEYADLDIESHRMNLENSKLGGTSNAVPMNDEEKQEEQDEKEEDTEYKQDESMNAEEDEADDDSSDDLSDDNSDDDSDTPKSEREKKDSKKKRKRLAKNEKFKEQLESVKREHNEKAEKIKHEIIESIFKLKEVIKGDESLVDKLQISKSDDTEKTWEAIEKRKIIEEFAKSAMEDDEDTNPTSASTLRRHVNKLFEDYYDSFFEDVNAATGDTFKFKYKSVDKADFGLTAEDIINLEDDDLDQVVSMKHLMRYDYKPPDEKVKKDIFFKVRNLKLQKGLLGKKSERALKFKQGKMGKKNKSKQHDVSGKDEGDKKNDNKKNKNSNKGGQTNKSQGAKRKLEQVEDTKPKSAPQNSNNAKKNPQKQQTKDVIATNSASQQEPPRKKKKRGKGGKNKQE
ncbi:hypothetical protein C9374_010872 [Naegleria lovaniensis]|uniref:Kri1-like C-terminal domain-containing protein n=1 Tax=Naegleria lovaniensis TaxID=51637 RepID=A0AA88KIW2_NAELO|nr:uncharacterized protein C9374_010872 [Naegleria lovaniensis]KAG2374302.1 hypothetical protein C9374_010872 [Naegleria lovaniensis]